MKKLKKKTIEIDKIFKIDNKHFKNPNDKEYYESAYKNMDDEDKLKYIFDAIKKYVELIFSKAINMETDYLTKIFYDILMVRYKRQLTPEIENKKDKGIIENQMVTYKKKEVINLNEKLKTAQFASFDTFMKNDFIDEYINQRYNDTVEDNTKKVLKNVCLNTDKILLLKDVPLDFRKTDMNGNTILNKLIDQYNLEAIKELVTKIDLIKTYKNNNDETAFKYCLDKIMSMNTSYQIYKVDENNTNNYVYDSNILLDKYAGYSEIIRKSLESNTEFTDITFSGAKEYTTTIFLNSMLQLSEFLWCRMYDVIGDDCFGDGEDGLWMLDDIENFNKYLFKFSNKNTFEQNTLKFRFYDRSTVEFETVINKKDKSHNNEIKKLEKMNAQIEHDCNNIKNNNIKNNNIKNKLKEKINENKKIIDKLTE